MVELETTWGNEDVPLSDHQLNYEQASHGVEKQLSLEHRDITVNWF